MEYISPEEDALFTKALKFLYERLAEINGFEVEADPHLVRKEDPAA